MSIQQRILAALARKNYQPLKPKALARKIGVVADEYAAFRKALTELAGQGRLQLAKNHTVRPAPPHGTVVGAFRRTDKGVGYVRPHTVEGQPTGSDVRIPQEHTLDAATGDTVLVKITRKPSGPGALRAGQITQILERASREFVGTYFEREGEGYVRVDGTVFSHSIAVGDPGAKGAKPDDKVVFEMVRFPSPEDRGEGVITEVLGPRGKPGVDTLSIVRAFNLPDEFPEDTKREAREAADVFREDDLEGREDFTKDLVVTVDPADARDFDDAVSVASDLDTGHWTLQVHIADVSHFAPPGGALDREARRRATSVYLPQRVLPMFPELISNSLASLQEGRVRYVKTAIIDFTPEGQKTGVRFANGAIRVKKRFAYEELLALLEGKPDAPKVDNAIHAMAHRMRDLAMILRKRRMRRGALELVMPEIQLEYDEQGRVKGAHYRSHDVSHQIIEEFMLSANEAVAEHFAELNIAFLRRVHPDPDPHKLESFAIFARSLGWKLKDETDRFTLQKVLERSAQSPEAAAIHYALLRSLKQAVYSPVEEGHYALASENYCHFTSPIRRYPDLTVHRLLGQWLRTGRAGSDEAELFGLGDHCSKMERRAEMAERELVKLKLLTYLSERLGLELDATVSGVADYGFYAQAETLPVEGLVHISTLPDDYYYYDPDGHCLLGQRTNRRYRLGDKVRVTVVRVDLQRRQLDLRVVVPGDKKPHRPHGSRRHE
jgi:ribonuclease R